MTSDDRVSFGSGSGRVTGVVALVLAAVIGGWSLVEGQGRGNLAVAAAAVFFAAVAWIAALRPAITVVGDDDLVLRNPLETVTVPLAAIASLDVRQVLVVRAGRRKITSSAIGRTRRQLTKDEGGSTSVLGSRFAARIPKIEGADGDARARSSYGALVEEQLRARVQTARDLAGVEVGSEEQAALADRIERRPAVPEIVVLAVSLVVFVVLLAI